MGIQGRRRATLTAVGATTMVAIVLVVTRAPGASADAGPPRSPPSAAPVSTSRSLPGSPPPARALAVALAAPSPAAPSPDEAASPGTSSRSATVLALARSGRPADAHAAYRLLAACAFAQNFERVDDGEGDAQVQAHRLALQEACGDLSPGQLGARVRLLEIAAAAHVSGAAADLVSQGPDGEPVAAVWNDPAYAAWKRHVLETVNAEAALGDRAALLVMNAQFDRGGALGPADGALAIQYWVAYADVTLATDPRYADPQRRRGFGDETARVVARYGASLSPAQVAAAVAAGHAFVGPALPP